MDNVRTVLSKFKCGLDDVISDYKNKVSDIVKEENFIKTLCDVVDYCRSDVLLLPFYDEEILSEIFNRVFPLSSSELKKLKAAKYLIEASKDIDKESFLQYNNAVKDINGIYDKLVSYYDKLVSNDNLSKDKEDYNLKINNYSKIMDMIGEDGFLSLIDDVDLFRDAVDVSGLSVDDVDLLLTVAIKDNLKYLDADGEVLVSSSDISSINELSNKIKEEIHDLSDLLGNE